MLKHFIPAALALAFGAAQAGVVCDTCSFQQGQPGTYLGEHNPLLDDNSTFGNSATGANGTFSNWWVFDINPSGNTSINAIFLPIRNISNFAVDLYGVASSACTLNTATTAGVCSVLNSAGLVASGITNPGYASAIDFTTLAAGRYAFNVTGLISGLGPNQPASYTGNLQVTAVPEPNGLALAGLGLVALGVVTRRKPQA